MRVEAVRREEAKIDALADALLLLMKELPDAELKKLQREIERNDKAHG